ncbi:MAG: hypothetical protein ACI9Y7_001854 [Dokdonia sp.]|jgi:hypothetical protein
MNFLKLTTKGFILAYSIVKNMSKKCDCYEILKIDFQLRLRKRCIGRVYKDFLCLQMTQLRVTN